MARVLIPIAAISTAVAGDIIGPVPASGPPLTIKKNSVTPQHLDLSWGDSCGPDQNDFAVYEGTIGNWYSHTKKLCTTAGGSGVLDLAPAPQSSYYLVVALSTTSEGSYGTNSANAEIPVGLSTCRANQSFDACVWQRVFVSSVPYTANLGGLVGADMKCQGLADAAVLGGTFKAWLSDNFQNAATRLTHSPLSYRRIDGALVASSETTFFSTTHVNPINLDEHGFVAGGVEVWTGSGGSGIGSGGCANWTSADPGGWYPEVGLSSQSNSNWSNVYLQLCDRVCYLYCVEQ